jgi:hypothetical protein
MSSIAYTTALRTIELDGLAEAAKSSKGWFGLRRKDACTPFLEKHGRPIADYQGPGIVVATALCYLEEDRKVDLLKSGHDVLATHLTDIRKIGHFFLTAEHKTFLPALSPEQFSESVLRDYFNEFNEQQEGEAGRAMMDALSFLRDSLAAVTEDNVVLLAVG